MKKYVYLAGPITGCDVAGANDWRTDLSAKFNDNIVGISPLRCEPLIGDKYELSYEDVRFGTPAAISSKNYHDTLNCDLILAYLPKTKKAERASYGTVWEIAWASMIRKPVVLVTDDEYIQQHPLFVDNVKWMVTNFDDALDIVHGLFDAYVGNTSITRRKPNLNMTNVKVK